MNRVSPGENLYKVWHYAIRHLTIIGYTIIFRPAIQTLTASIKQFVKSPSEKDSYRLSKIIRNYKTQATWACDAITEIAIPLGDFYILQTAITRTSQFANMQFLNTVLNSPFFTHISPIAFRGVNVMLEFYSQCQELNIKNESSPLSSLAEFPIRASEFTAWYNLYNYYLESKISNKPLLSLLNKLISIYSIKFLDQVEYVALENKEPVFDTKFALLPLTKNPTTAICKVPVDTFFTNPWTKYSTEIFCNFLGEISYAATEKYLDSRNNTLGEIMSSVATSQTVVYLGSKSIWKTVHQRFEKEITKDSNLGKIVGFRAMALISPRNFITKKLKDFAQAIDSSEYLDPDLVELCDFFGVKPVEIKSTDNLLLTVQSQGKCMTPTRISLKLMNITQNLWGHTEIPLEDIARCTAKRFSTCTILENHPTYDVGAINLKMRNFLNTSASECLEQYLIKNSEKESPEPSFMESITGMIQDIWYNWY